MQTNDFIRVKYSAKIKENGVKFDSNNDMPLVVGANWIMKALDEALLEMDVGSKKEVEVAPENGFGNRNDKLIKLVSEAEFKRHGQKPHPGMIINADNMAGRVLSVSGGRVKIDFNHPLAGKTLLFEMEILRKVEKENEKIKTIVEWFMRPNTDADKELFEKIEVKIHGKQAEIDLPSLVNLNSLHKKKIADDVIKLLELEKIKYIETYEKTVIDEKKIEELTDKLGVKEIEEENTQPSNVEPN